MDSLNGLLKNYTPWWGTSRLYLHYKNRACLQKWAYPFSAGRLSVVRRRDLFVTQPSVSKRFVCGMVLLLLPWTYPYRPSKLFRAFPHSFRCWRIVVRQQNLWRLFGSGNFPTVWYNAVCKHSKVLNPKAFLIVSFAFPLGNLWLGCTSNRCEMLVPAPWRWASDRFGRYTMPP